jgi:intracellular sulfur oxidation DsrE/DsrF family protein
MTIKKLLTYSIAAILITIAQTASAQKPAKVFAGAEATKKSYKALFILNDGDEKTIKGTLRNIKNSLEDPRLKGKLQIELIAFSDGVAVYSKEGPYEETLKALQAKGVILAQCENTVRERKIDKNTLFPFISYVPSGVGEIIIREYQGWATVHP